MILNSKKANKQRHDTLKLKAKNYKKQIKKIIEKNIETLPIKVICQQLTSCTHDQVSISNKNDEKKLAVQDFNCTDMPYVPASTKLKWILSISNYIKSNPRFI